MSANRIEIDDEVTVVFSHDHPPKFFRGVVKHIPQDTGDCWVIVERGDVHHVRTFQEIIRYANT